MSTSWDDSDAALSDEQAFAHIAQQQGGLVEICVLNATLRDWQLVIEYFTDKGCVIRFTKSGMESEGKYRHVHPVVQLERSIVPIHSADEFVRLRYSDNADEYGRAAHDSAPIHVWQEVIEKYPDARVWVAQNKTVPIAILETLASDRDPRVRVMVAMKRKSPTQLLALLAMDVEEPVRMAVAKHYNASREILESLREDPWVEIRRVVAQRLEGR